MIKELLQNKLPRKRNNIFPHKTFSPKYLRICCSPYEYDINNLFKHIKHSSHKPTTNTYNNNNLTTSNMKPLSSSIPKNRNTQPAVQDNDNTNNNSNSTNNNNSHNVNNNDTPSNTNNNDNNTNSINNGNNTNTKPPLSSSRSNRSSSAHQNNKPSVHDKETQTSNVPNPEPNNDITPSNSNTNKSKSNSPPSSAFPNNNSNNNNSSLSTKPKPNQIQTNFLPNSLTDNALSPLLSQTKLRKSNSSLSSPYLSSNTNHPRSPTSSSPFSSKQSRKLRNKYQHQYITSLSNEHCNDIQSLHHATQTASKQTAQNIKTLQTWLAQIKQNGFDKQEAKIKERELIRSKLTHSVKLIHAQINANTKSFKTANGSKSKYTFENRINKSKIDKHKKESEAFLKEIDALKEEIPAYAPQIEGLKNETAEINEDVMKESHDVSNMKQRIKEINKMIAGICKEKDALRYELNVVKKQIKLMRGKVNEMYNKNANFMLNVNQLIEDNQLENSLNI